MTSSWFFLSTLNYDARSTTYQKYVFFSPHVFDSCVCVCVCVSQKQKSGLGRLIVKVSRSHKHTHKHTHTHTHTYSLSHTSTPSTTPLQVWSAPPTVRYLCNTRSTKKNNRTLSGIPIHNHVNRAAAGLHHKRTANRIYCWYSLHHFHSVSVFDTRAVWNFVM